MTCPCTPAITGEGQGRGCECSRKASCEALGIDPDEDFLFTWADAWVALVGAFVMALIGSYIGGL